MKTDQQKVIFYIIIIAQFCGTSLWFAGNAVLPQLQQEFAWPASSLGYLTSATQLGFIAGTLTFALLGIADRFSPSKTFFVSSLIAAASNILALLDVSSFSLVIISRCLTGFFLAGIYPIGMKIAADWKEEGLGHWLGALVGALVLGTSFPHALKVIPQFVEPNVLLSGISLLAVFGGLLLLILVPDGPFRKAGGAFSFNSIKTIFKVPPFRAPSLGYFGHMWELYAFWAFVPVIVLHYQAQHVIHTDASMLSFLIIASGGVGCVAGGMLSSRYGSASVARYALIISGLCCLVSPLIWDLSFWLFFAVMIVWGTTVAADSPQFSALVAKNAPHQIRGSAITLVICIGFAITVVSIQLLNALQQFVPKEYLFLLLTPGPILGVVAMRTPSGNPIRGGVGRETTKAN